MAYEIFIERERREISLKEWASAVEDTPGARLTSAPVQGQNPATGEVVSVGSRPGTVEVAFRSGGFLGIGRKTTWETSISFFKGRGKFRATKDIENPGNAVHQVVSSLARFLEADIRGEAGETYDW